MGLYTKESLDRLRDKIDLAEVISSYVPLKRAGATFKALCPFHEEKTPSFVVQAGDTHYHCFGCGAHGDAMAFVMNHLKLSFVEAVEMLAERFGISLEKTVQGEKKGPDRVALKEALEFATRFYHTALLYTQEGHEALQYLYQRNISLEFIEQFRIGYAPKKGNDLLILAKKGGISEEILFQAGLITEGGRDFFSERIAFPITDAFQAVIGFSARKFRESTFGGKYINTPETSLFKKSHVLFGLSFSRKRIAKERKAVVVEGQIDALRLIYNGLDLVVAGQGTAFGEGHVKELQQLGVNQVYLAMDGDSAGQQAAIKIGNLLQKKGIGVFIVALPKESDPDQFVREKGIDAFQHLMENAKDYLPFLIAKESEQYNLQIPAQKNEMLQKILQMVRSWEEPVMVHESLRKVAELTHVPESVVGVGASLPFKMIKSGGILQKEGVDPDRVLETDLLRWLILKGDERMMAITRLNMIPDLFRNQFCKKIYEKFMEYKSNHQPCDLISLGNILESEEEQNLLADLVVKKVNLDKAEEGLTEVIHRILIRKWMEEREAIKVKIQSGGVSDREILDLAKTFDAIKKNQPTVVLP